MNSRQRRIALRACPMKAGTKWECKYKARFGGYPIVTILRVVNLSTIRVRWPDGSESYATKSGFQAIQRAT